MENVIDEELYRRTEALLEPGDIELQGLIVHTDLGGDDDIEMMQATLAVGDVVAEHAGHDPSDVYVYSGNDDEEFASNQHQGKTIDGDEFVWECQQLLRDGTFDLVFYFEADADLDAIVDEVEAEGYRVQPVEGP
jgi:catechol 2,3-dioxygenase-like lactoylglutathione lyase family enzyme